MKWDKDPLLWEKIDALMINSSNDIKELLDILFEHDNELHPTFRAMMFGGVGQFFMTYNEARNETNTPELSLALSIEQVMKNPAFESIIKENIENTIDNTVKNMEGKI